MISPPQSFNSLSIALEGEKMAFYQVFTYETSTDEANNKEAIN